MITKVEWQLIQRYKDQFDKAPEWVNDVLTLDFDIVAMLPEFGPNSPLNGPLRPTVEGIEITAEYLSFLQLQSKIDARGPEWMRVMAERCQALKPLVGMRLYSYVLRNGQHGLVERFWVLIDRQSRKLVYTESL